MSLTIDCSIHWAVPVGTLHLLYQLVVWASSKIASPNEPLPNSWSQFYTIHTGHTWPPKFIKSAVPTLWSFWKKTRFKSLVPTTFKHGSQIIVWTSSKTTSWSSTSLHHHPQEGIMGWLHPKGASHPSSKFHQSSVLSVFHPHLPPVSSWARYTTKQTNTVIHQSRCCHQPKQTKS